MRYSELFNINPSQLDRLGVFNANVNEDSNLHIDPSLLKDCTIPEFKDSYQKFLIIFLLFLNWREVLVLIFGVLKSWYLDLSLRKLLIQA